MLQAKVVEKIKTHILYQMNFFRKLCQLWNNVEKYDGTRQATQDDTIQSRKYVICMPYN